MPKKTAVGVSMLSPEYEVEEAERLLDELGVPRTEAHERTGDTVEFTVTGRLLWLVENAPGVKEVIQQAVEKQRQTDETRRQNASKQPYKDAAGRKIWLHSVVSSQGSEYEVVEIRMDGTVGGRRGRWLEAPRRLIFEANTSIKNLLVSELTVTGYNGLRHAWRVADSDYPPEEPDYYDDGED